MAESYRAVEPSLVGSLVQLGLLDSETEKRNLEQWKTEIAHCDELWEQAKVEWHKLSHWQQFRITFGRGKFDWKLNWRRENDPWRDEA